MIINRKVRVSGHFTIYKERPGEDRVKVAEFDNLITNSGMDYLANAYFARNVRLGTGTTTPAFTDVALANQLYVSGDIGSGYAVGPAVSGEYCSLSLTWTLPQGAVVGNLSEVGTSPSSGSNLFSRALIVDGSGNPTTITVTALDILTVVYQLRMYFDTSDHVVNTTVNGTAYTLTSRGQTQTSICMFRWYTFGLTGAGGVDTLVLGTGAGALGPRTGSLTGYTRINASGSQTSSYTAGTYYRDLVFPVGINSGNHANGITCWDMSDGADYWGIGVQTVVTPAIMKTNTMSMTITNRLSWARYTP